MASDGTIKVDRIAKNNATTGTTMMNPIIMSSNTLLGSVANGAIEYDGTYFYITYGSTRYCINYPRKIVPGELTLSYSNSTTFGVATGGVLDSTYSYALALSSAWTKTTASWVVGTGNGSLDTGSVAASKTYHAYLIRKDSDASIDVLISLSATAPTMPGGYTYKRRIGCIRTDGSNNILKFYQHGNMFRFDAKQQDYPYAVFASGSRILQTVSAPEGCIGIFIATVAWASTAASHYAIFQATEETDTVASSSNNTHFVYVNSAPVVMELQINVDSSRQIAVRSDGSTTNLYWQLQTSGWIDPGI